MPNWNLIEDWYMMATGFRKGIITGPASQLDPALKGQGARVVFSRLFKYTQLNTAGFTENSIGLRTI